MKSKVFTNLIWRFLERCGAQGVTFIVSIVLARLLEPKIYGTVALVTVFITIIQVFVDSGMGNALIQKKDVDDLDYSSVFYFNLTMCVVLYLILYIIAPFIASFYKMSDLVPIIRTLGIVIIVSGVKNVQQAFVARNMMFKKFFFSTLSGTIGAAIVGIVMAYCGAGVWALVAQMLFNTIVDTTILWLTVKWRPKKMFSLERLKNLISFGWKLLISTLLDTVYNDLRQLIIGKMYSSSDLAMYNQGKKFPQVIVININTSIDSVLLPTLSQEQDNVVRLKMMTRRAIKTSTYIMMPFMIGLAVCAEPLVDLILTEKWLPCVPFMRVFCFSYAFYPIHTANLNAIKALGRSDLFLKLEVWKKCVGLIAIFSTMWISVEAMVYSLFVTTIISTIINAFPNKSLLGYSWSEQMKDILPQIGISLIMGAIVFLIQFIDMNDMVILFIQIVIGLLVYLFLSKLTHIDSYEYLTTMLKRIFKRG